MLVSRTSTPVYNSPCHEIFDIKWRTVYIFGVSSDAFGVYAVSAQLEPRPGHSMFRGFPRFLQTSKLNQFAAASHNIVSTLQFNVIPSFDSLHVEGFSL